MMTPTDCQACVTELLCPGLVLDGQGRARRCRRRQEQDALEMLPQSGLHELVCDHDLRGLDPAASLLLIEDPDFVWSVRALQHLVTLSLLAGQPATFVPLVAWAGRQWELMRLDLSGPALVAFALPDLVKAGDPWLDQMAQLIMGRVVGGGRTAIATFGEWRARTQVESLLIQEVRVRNVP